MGKEKRYLLRNWKRYMAVVLGITLTVAQLSIPVTAAEGTEAKTGTETGLTAGGLCEHHTAHTDACGYQEAVKGQECNHEHTDVCYEEVTDCKHEHTDACYETQPAAEESAEEKNPQKILNCTHVCSEGSGCIVKNLNCNHTHDDTCGFAAPVEGNPCTFVCTECGKTGTPQEPGGDTTQGEDGEQESSDRTEAVKNVQELIDTLPAVTDIETEIETMKEENKAALKEQLAEAKTAYEKLTDEEKKQITEADKLEKLLELIKGAENQTSDKTVTEAVKNVQTLIGALPSVDEVKAMNEEDRNTAYARAQEANEAYAALTEEEQTQVDITKIEALFGYFNSLTAVNGTISEEQTDDSVAEVNGVYYADFMEALNASMAQNYMPPSERTYCKLLKDITVNGDISSTSATNFALDLNGHTLKCNTLYLGNSTYSLIKGPGTVNGNISVCYAYLYAPLTVYGNILQNGVSNLQVLGSGVFRVNGDIADFTNDSDIEDGVTIVCTGTCSESDIKDYLRKDGSTLIKEPSNLTATYGQKLSDISLPTGWEWADNETFVFVGTQSYPARFDTTDKESEYDFTNVAGYTQANHYVQRNLSVAVSKGATVLTITTESMDKTYDGNAVTEPSVIKTGSTKDVTFTWYERNGDDWTELASAPVNAGSYQVVAKVEADDNYNGEESERIFTVNRAMPEFTRPVGLTAVYGQCLKDVSLPSADNGSFLWGESPTMKVGDVGERIFHWTFEPTNNRNFEEVIRQPVTITVTPKSLADSMIAPIADQYYTGAAIKPAITVTDTAGITKEDYKVSYSHNTDVGTATVTINGRNNYTGTAFRNFTIKNIDAPDILANGATLANTYSWYASDVIIDGDTPAEWSVSTDSIHYADTYTVSTEGTNRVRLYFKNAAGYITAVQNVVVSLDKTAPTGRIMLESKWWENALTFLSFNHYKADNKQLTIRAADVTSGVNTIEYLIVKGDTQYRNKDDLENAVNSDASLNWQTYAGTNKPIVPTDENCGVYAKITDHAGLITYIGTDGLLIDDTAPTITNPAVSTADTDMTVHSAKFSFTLSEPATCYYLAVESTKTAPTQAELLASSQKQTVGAEELNNVSARITGLAEGTTYRIYMLAVDNAVNISETDGMGNVSTISSTGEFTTKVQVKTPSITPNGGEYTLDKLQVTMTCATEGVTIYYTTDGTQPTTGSSRYQGAFEVTIPATVKAIAVKSGMADSEVASVSYTKKGNTGGGNSGGNDNNQGDNDSQDDDNNQGNDDTPVQPPVIPVQPTKPPVQPVTPTNPVNPVKPVKPTPEPEEEEPFIKGDDGREGWPVITDRTEAAKDGDKIVVDMNGSTTVPGEVIESVAGRDVTIVFDMGDGILWTVNGKSVTADNISDIQFGVLRNTKNIPVEVINNVTGERYSITITIEHDGEFGFTAVLTVNMEKKNAGLYANLFYYNKAAEELEFMCADEIDADGNTELSFTHASDYTIVIDKEPMDGSGADGEEAAETGTDTAGVGEGEAQDSVPAAPATVEGRKDIMDYLWIILLGAVVIVAGVGGYVYFMGKKKDDEAEQK